MSGKASDISTDVSSAAPTQAEAGRSIARNATIVGAMTFLSRLGGLVREQLMAYFFGAGVAKSAFDVAYRVPNLFRRLFGEGALSAALIPVYTETMRKEGKDEADRLAAGVAGAIVALLSVAAAAGIAVTYPIAMRLDADGRWAQILPLLRIMFPYAPLICLAALIMGVLNSLKSFAVSALAPAFQNLCWILALACVCPFLPAEDDTRIKAVAWSILVSGVVQVAVQLPVLARHGVPRRLLFGMFGNEKVRRVFRLMLPMALAAGVVQINVCIDSWLAMYAGVWGPSALGYADRLIYFPLAIFGTAFATALLPSLSVSVAADDFGAFSANFRDSFSAMCAIMLPSAAGLMALSVPLVSLIYEMGAFDAQSTIRTSHALMAYGAGLVAAGATKIAPQAFYAMQEPKTPVAVGLACVGLNFCLNLFFIWILPVEWKPIGIAFATSISSLVHCVALLLILSRRSRGGSRLFRWSSVAWPFTASLISSAAMGLCAHFAFGWLNGAIGGSLHPKAACAVAVFATIAVSAVAYAALLHLLCPSLLANALKSLRRRRRRP